jgi:hypothetical protein
VRNPTQSESRTDSKPVASQPYSKPRLQSYGHVGALTQGGTGGRAEFINKIGMQQMNKNRRN